MWYFTEGAYGRPCGISINTGSLLFVRRFDPLQAVSILGISTKGLRERVAMCNLGVRVCESTYDVGQRMSVVGHKRVSTPRWLELHLYFGLHVHMCVDEQGNGYLQREHQGMFTEFWGAAIEVPFYSR